MPRSAAAIAMLIVAWPRSYSIEARSPGSSVSGASSATVAADVATCWAHCQTFESSRSRWRSVTTTKSHRWSFRDEGERHPASRIRSSCSGAIGRSEYASTFRRPRMASQVSIPGIYAPQGLPSPWRTRSSLGTLRAEPRVDAVFGAELAICPMASAEDRASHRASSVVASFSREWNFAHHDRTNPPLRPLAALEHGRGRFSPKRLLQPKATHERSVASRRLTWRLSARPTLPRRRMEWRSRIIDGSGRFSLPLALRPGELARAIGALVAGPWVVVDLQG